MTMPEMREILVKNSRSVIAFESVGTDSAPGFDRLLTIGGQDAFHIGNICDTCAFFFEKLGDTGTKIQVDALADDLNRGVTHLDPCVTGDLTAIVPNGNYIAMFSEIHPELCAPRGPYDYFCREQWALWELAWGVPNDGPHNPRTEYYRLTALKLTGKNGFFEFLIPTFSSLTLNQQRVEEYRREIAGGSRPTVVALSVLDVKQPCEWKESAHVTSHWCLAHYLLDGHHKAYAAALAGKPITMISFIAVEQGVSTREDLDWALANAFAL